MAAYRHLRMTVQLSKKGQSQHMPLSVRGGDKTGYWSVGTMLMRVE